MRLGFDPGGRAWGTAWLTQCPCLNRSGVGRALCQRLLDADDGLHLCLACRNRDRAEAVRAALLAAWPAAQVSTVQVDVSDLRSVLRAASELRHRWASGRGRSQGLCVTQELAVRERPWKGPRAVRSGAGKFLFVNVLLS